MRVRALALRLHFFVGTITGVALIVLGLSGTVLVFRPELEGVRSSARAPASSDVSLVPPQTLAEAARRRHPGFIVTDLLLPDDRTAAARVRMLDQAGGQVEVLVDPHTGEALGSFWLERSPLYALRLLHAELYMGSRGAVAVGVLGLWLLLQGVTGLYLSWPMLRRPHWGFRIRWSRPWPVVGRDFHKALGAASILFHLPMAATGATLGLSAILSGATDHRPTASGSVQGFRVSLDALARGAEAAVRGGRTTALHLSPHGGTVTVKLRTPGDLDPRGASVVILTASDARVLSVRDARRASWAASVFAAVRALHVGDVGGSLARTLYVLGGLASVSVAISGYVLAVARPGRLDRVRAASP